MTPEESGGLWIKNEKEHAEIKAMIAEVKGYVSVVPLIFKWCVFPLIVVLGTIVGADKLLTQIVR